LGAGREGFYSFSDAKENLWREREDRKKQVLKYHVIFASGSLAEWQKL
jgi:hypothetical protein